LSKYDDKTIQTNYKNILGEIRSRFHKELGEESMYTDENSDTLIAEGKYNSIEEGNAQTDSLGEYLWKDLTAGLKKAYYGITLGSQIAKEKITGARVLENGEGPLQAVGVLADVGVGIADTIKEDVTK
jgi:hypothetical protein